MRDWYYINDRAEVHYLGFFDLYCDAWRAAPGDAALVIDREDLVSLRADTEFFLKEQTA